VLHGNEELLKAKEYRLQEVSCHGFAGFRVRSVVDNAADVAFEG
jgi:hypothetical protein